MPPLTQSRQTPDPHARIAIIGADPSGLVTARWLLARVAGADGLRGRRQPRRPVEQRRTPQRHLAGTAHHHQSRDDRLAQGGAGAVAVAMRKQRYVLPKLIAGVPTDHVMFNRAAALAAEILPPEAQAEALKSAVLRAAGKPAQFGAAAPDENIFVAGISQSQGFLPAVAEGRIATYPWIDRIEGRAVHFADRRTIEVDAILFGTGFRPAMPWLAPDVAASIGLDRPAPDLLQTFHPDLAGLAVVDLYDLVGPYLPVLEVQARWVAPPTLPMHALAVQFARLAGVEPDPMRFLHLVASSPLDPRDEPLYQDVGVPRGTCGLRRVSGHLT